MKSRICSLHVGYKTLGQFGGIGAQPLSERIRLFNNQVCFEAHEVLEDIGRAALIKEKILTRTDSSCRGSAPPQQWKPGRRARLRPAAVGAFPTMAQTRQTAPARRLQSRLAIFRRSCGVAEPDKFRAEAWITAFSRKIKLGRFIYNNQENLLHNSAELEPSSPEHSCQQLQISGA
jgi:hypothetical protein